jgi:hypothetical protein
VAEVAEVAEVAQVEGVVSDKHCSLFGKKLEYFLLSSLVENLQAKTFYDCNFCRITIS